MLKIPGAYRINETGNSKTDSRAKRKDVTSLIFPPGDTEKSSHGEKATSRKKTPGGGKKKGTLAELITPRTERGKGSS